MSELYDVYQMSGCKRLQPHKGKAPSPGIARAQVADVKQKIGSSQGADFPVSQQVIIYQGKVGPLRGQVHIHEAPLFTLLALLRAGAEG